MPRKTHPRRTLKEIFVLGREIGQENVLLNDAELGAVLAGRDSDAFVQGTVSNMRYTGHVTTPVVRTGRVPRTRLSDALSYVQKKTRPAA